MSDDERTTLIMYYVHEALRLDSEIEAAESVFYSRKLPQDARRLASLMERRAMWSKMMRDVMRLLHID